MNLFSKSQLHQVHRIIFVLFLLISFISPSNNALAVEARDCSVVKLGLKFPPKSPGEVSNDGRNVGGSELKNLRAIYSSQTSLEVNWSPWAEIRSSTETYFYAAYLLYFSSNAGQSWSCIRISDALISETLENLQPNTNYQIALIATNGTVWSKPIYTSASTNPNNRPIQQLCLPDSLENQVRFFGSGVSLAITNGNVDLPVRWEYSFDGWKSKKKYKSPYGEEYVPLRQPLIFSTPNSKASVLNIRGFAAADKIPKIFKSESVLGYTSKNCSIREFVLLKNEEEVVDCSLSTNSKYCVPANSSKSRSITCRKGQDKAVITGNKPKCPTGYRLE
jgi:hypothetical protein